MNGTGIQPATNVDLSAFFNRDSRARPVHSSCPIPITLVFQSASKARYECANAKSHVLPLSPPSILFSLFLLFALDFSRRAIGPSACAYALFGLCLPFSLLPIPPYLRHLRSHVVVDTVGENGRAADDETHRLRPRQPDFLLKPPEERRHTPANRGRERADVTHTS